MMAPVGCSGWGVKGLQTPWRSYHAKLTLLVGLFLVTGAESDQKMGGNLTTHSQPLDGSGLKTVKEVETQEEEPEVSDELRLVRYLLETYERMGTIARPTYNSSMPTTIYFGMRLMQIELDEKQQLMSTSVWERVRWTDEYLRWNPDDFGGFTRISLPWDKVWTPDVVLVNAVSGLGTDDPADISVHHEGYVFWSPHRLYKSGCLIDISNFPFDHHHCEMWFQSKSHISSRMDLKPYTYDPWDLQTYMDSYKESQSWEIIGNATDRFDAKRKALILKYSKRTSLRFSLTVKRRPGYNCHLLMVPCFLLGALTLVVFCLPAEGSDRISLSMGLFASFIVLLLILVEAAPPSAGNVPQLGLFYAANMVLIISSIFLSASIISVARGKETKVPVPLRFIFLDLLSRPLFLHGRVVRILGPRHPISELKEDETPCQTTTSKMDGWTTEMEKGEGTRTEKEDGQVLKHLLSIEEKLNRLELNLKHSSSQPGESSEQAYRCQEWHMVSVVMDRLCFMLYLVALILSAVLFFPRPAAV